MSESVELNNDGLPKGGAVTFEQIAAANQKRAKKAKQEAVSKPVEVKAKPAAVKTKSK